MILHNPLKTKRAKKGIGEEKTKKKKRGGGRISRC